MKALTVGDLRKILANFKGPDTAEIGVLVREYTKRYATWITPNYWEERLNGGYSAREDVLLIAAKFQDDNDTQYVSTSVRKKR